MYVNAQDVYSHW